jgi:hypothetical protein
VRDVFKCKVMRNSGTFVHVGAVPCLMEFAADRTGFCPRPASADVWWTN